MMRAIAAISGSALLAVAAFYLSSQFTRSLAVAIAAAVGLAALVATLLVTRARRRNAMRSVALATALVGIAAPLLLNGFIRLDYERYVWVIRQPGACGYLGSGPLLLTIGLAFWSFGFGALALVLATRGLGDPLLPRGGLVLGAVLVLGGVLLALPDPHPLAALLGCQR